MAKPSVQARVSRIKDSRLQPAHGFVVAVDRRPFHRGDSIFTEVTQPGGRKIKVLNRTVFERAVERARASLRKSATPSR